MKHRLREGDEKTEYREVVELLWKRSKYVVVLGRQGPCFFDCISPIRVYPAPIDPPYPAVERLLVKCFLPAAYFVAARHGIADCCC